MAHIYKFEAMTTECEVTLLTHDKAKADSCAQAILHEAKRLEKKYSYYNENSTLSQINQRTLTLLDSETKSIMQRAIQYYHQTNKVFDITIATIKELYRHEMALDTLHVKEKALKKYVGCEHIKIKKDKISFDNEFTMIDLGGFVKELAVDNAIKIVKKAKIEAALINFGGDIYALGRKADGSKFKVGIKNPEDTSLHVEYFELENEALTTSASYERNYTIQEKKYSHILSLTDTKNSLSSASVIARNCVESGVYSTSLMIDENVDTTNRVYLLHTKDKL